METRAERYTRYRERIKNMSEMEFPKTKEGKKSFSEMEARLSGSAISLSGETPNYGLNNAPYRIYLKKRRRIFLLKVIVSLLLIAGLVVWYLLMQGRAGK